MILETLPRPQPLYFSAQATPSVPPRSALDRLEGVNLATPVLIIEDEVMIAWMTESFLQDLGFTTIEIASTGEDALRSAERRTPGLVISDVNLGAGMDGVAASVAIQAISPAPVIFVTGYANTESQARVDRDLAGAAVLRKPLEAHDLRTAIIASLQRPKAN